MIIELEVLIPDRPGALIEMLTPISENDCNILSISHGEKREEDGLIRVSAKLEAADRSFRDVMNLIRTRYGELRIEIIRFAAAGLVGSGAKQKKRVLVVLLDGATDVPLPELGNRTPLEVAGIPTLHRLAKEGVCGSFTALGSGTLVGSDTAMLAILGYDPYRVYTGRGPLEVAGAGLDLRPGDVSLRCNYVTITDDFRLVNRTAGYPREGLDRLEKALNRIRLSDPKVEFRFSNSQDYRCVVRFRGYKISADVSDMDPHYNAVADALDNLDLLGEGESKIITAKPLKATAEARNMADILNEFVTKAHRVLRDLPFNRARVARGLPPVNGIMPRGAGETPSLPSFQSRWGMRGGCVAGTGLIKGVGRLTGMTVPEVPGATGYVDTDYLGKARKALDLLADNHDFVLIHVEGIDEVSHDRDAKAKIKALEDSSEGLVRHLVENLPDDVVLCVLSDHTSSTLLGDHTIDPTGILIWSKARGFRSDPAERFVESEFPRGSLARVEGREVVPLLMGFAQRLQKFGA
ncbi:MAG: 2,3-bisphosphoglycerate-independent phosphoglycerate mutase [Deltaproteobacteria bacterium]|nr:2,3-bisphosphoglycerate-independent phosphoglycerate mutase [Deltaproteobacteria bacterium]MBW2120249.1 2,3-bisphosphoglycerate-independent phosphoglycerate mutase [Deltaproteobacteria bacterium]